MIWKLPHPVLRLATSLVVFMVGGMLLGFGVGMPEMIALLLASAVAFVLSANWRSGHGRTATSS